MKGYSKTDTIILWSENKEIIKYTQELAKELGVQVFEPEVISDLVAIPCFIQIIDAKHLLEFLNFLGSDASINEYFYYNDCKIALIGKVRFSVPYMLKEVLEILPEIISKKLFLPIIKHNLESAIREAGFRNKQFKKRIFRILTLHHLIESGENVDNEKLAFKYDTSIKTINRDIEVLRLLNPNRNFFLYRQGYTTVNGHNNVSKISVKISKRQEALLNQVSRLIDLYQLLKMGLPIHVEETCAKYKISDRSLRRDIKLFKDVNPDRKISFDKVKGYY